MAAASERVGVGALQAPGDGAGGADGADGAQILDDGAGGATGSAGSSSGPENPGGRDGTATSGTVAGEAPQVEGASPAPRQGGEASASASASGDASEKQVLEFALTVPFLCYVDAELTHQYLTSSAECYHEAVHTELTVIGSDLFIRLTAEDPVLLQISTASLLNQLSMVVQTMQHLVPAIFSRPRPGKGG
ncbi:cancer/testis antigen 2-like [Lynx rufus]|uniref:cancer/testis antigen 2-like n=1 Tax=Lynx rufus TaxID=61384 RepID=UPI001F123C45|nr:cancer/testis antigen 2-like [Lynx rufus]XP_046956660.1 cancer/testis antigen 2-like [Lynx rufus]